MKIPLDRRRASYFGSKHALIEALGFFRGVFREIARIQLARTGKR